MGRQRVDLKEAAQRLGVTTEAVRKRAKRGTLDSETGEDGRLYVWVDDGSDTGWMPGGQDRLVVRLESENEYLRRQLDEEREANRENRRIIAGLVQRVPELEPVREAPSESRESPETASEGAEGLETPLQQERRSWWRRLFEG